MARPVSLFTGQWADLPFETLCQKAKSFGYEALELACWGDHFDIVKALSDSSYVKNRWETLSKYGLNCHAISNHLVGQAICDNIDGRHQCILPPEVWGDGQPEGVRKRAAQRMADAAKACRKFMDARPASCPAIPGYGAVVNGFTGSSIWGSIYAFPPTDQKYWQKGFDDFAKRFEPILAEFEKQNVNFALEAHPTEIAFDIASAQRALEAVKNNKRFGFNYDPSHFGYQHVDYVKFIRTFANRIYHVHMKDAWWGHGNGDAGVFGGHTNFADARRYWDFRSLGHGDINFEEIIVALNDIQYQGPLSVEWEDSRMDREFGATEAAAFVKKLNFKPSAIAFDAQFDR
ncbi:MAG TPA: sugar phosphate isomerase/epimerase [Tepidisphaeraceae bacterium]|nr:sugar phosphate isomerase/epimerase [Tepidisphaeraceae bacterium]